MTNESDDVIIESNDRGATASGEHRQTQRMNLPAQDRRLGTGKNTTGEIKLLEVLKMKKWYDMQNVSNTVLEYKIMERKF